MMRRYILLIILISLFTAVKAQETVSDEIEFSADRPGMATGTTLMQHKKMMFESGFEFNYSEGWDSHLLPTALIRWGVLPKMELRLQYDGSLDRDESWRYNAGPLTIGTKVAIFDANQSRWAPNIAFMANFAIPVRKDAGELLPMFHFLFDKDVCDWLNVGFDAGVKWDTFFDTPPVTFLALCLGFSITDDLGAFVESYNYIIPTQDNGAEGDCNIDFGFNYMVSPRVQLDVYSSVNCQNPAQNSNVGVGVAWLIN